MAQRVCSISASLCVIFVCHIWTIGGWESQQSNPNPAKGSTTIHCRKPKSKLIIDSAEFSPADKRFCDLETCSSLSDVNSTDCRLVPGESGGSKICNRKFGDQDMWKVYRGCADKVHLGKPCDLSHVSGLSQGGSYYLGDYHCLKDTSVVDPCNVFGAKKTEYLYHDLSSLTQRRLCTCTASVKFRESSDKDVTSLHMSYLLMLDPSLPLSRSQEVLKATVTSGGDEVKLNASSSPDFLIVNVTQHSPTFVVTFRVFDTELSGFVWMKISDRKVRVNCTTSTGFTEASAIMTTIASSIISVRSSTNSTDIDWLTMSAVASAAGALAVIITVVTLCIVLKRRSRQTLTPSTLPAGSDRSLADPLNSVYAEVNPVIVQTSFALNRHRRHETSPDYMEPSRVPGSLAGTDVIDYAILQRHQGQGAPPGSASVDTYDHVMRSTDEYQALEREPHRQEVIDNDYDSTEGFS